MAEKTIRNKKGANTSQKSLTPKYLLIEDNANLCKVFHISLVKWKIKKKKTVILYPTFSVLPKNTFQKNTILDTMKLH